jgi:hypothetical protein
VSDEIEPLDVERGCDLEHILGVPHPTVGPDPRGWARATAAEIGHDDLVSATDQGSCDGVEAPRIRVETVQADDRRCTSSAEPVRADPTGRQPKVQGVGFEKELRREEFFPHDPI